MAQFPNTTAADGIWTLKKVRRAILGNNWPEVIVADQFFANTVLLLNADGASDGGQNNTFLDSSSNAHTITRNGNTTQGSFSPFSVDDGKWGNYFDGNGDYLAIPDSTDFDFGTGDFTWEAWIRTNVNVNYQNIVGQWDGGPAWGIHTNNTGTITYFTNTSTVYVGTITVTDDAWHHIAVARASGTVRLFVDGVADGSASDTNAVGDTGNVRIGSLRTGYERYFAGYISNVRLVKGTAVYTTDFTPSTTPLTAISGTSLLTCQSNRFVDNSSNAHSLTVNGTPKVVPFSPFPQTTAYSASTNGGSGYFDGTGDYLSIADDASLDLGGGNFTVECWFYLENVNSDQIFVSNYQNSTSGYAIRVTSNVVRVNLTGDGYDITGTTAVKANNWYHVALSGSPGSVKLFLNGVQEGSTFTGSLGMGSASPTTIGTLFLSGTAYYPVDGYITDLRIVKGTALYTSAFTPPTAPLTDVTNTSLLCNFTNAGIYDGTGRNVLETVGDAHVENSVKKYGTGSMQFDGTGDWLEVPASEQFSMGTGDFTAECWFYANSTSARGLFQITTGHLISQDTGIALGVSSNTGNPWRVYHGTTATDTSSNLVTGSWQHIAIVRNGTAINIYLDGTSIYSATDASDLSSYQVLTVGAWYSSSFPWNGYIDDLRITKGVARYTANFTPPAAKLEQQ